MNGLEAIRRLETGVYGSLGGSKGREAFPHLFDCRMAREDQEEDIVHPPDVLGTLVQLSHLVAKHRCRGGLDLEKPTQLGEERFIPKVARAVLVKDQSANVVEDGLGWLAIPIKSCACRSKVSSLLVVVLSIVSPHASRWSALKVI